MSHVVQFAIIILAVCVAALTAAAIGEILADSIRHRTLKSRGLAVKDINDDLTGAAHV